MLLSVEVSLYCPRFVVMEVKDGKPRIVHTAINDHQRESSMAQHRRTSYGNLLMEIADKLAFILTAYPVTDAVWYIRPLAPANQEAARTALGAILLTLEQHGVQVAEIICSRAHLLLTGTSKPNPQRLRRIMRQLLFSIPDGYDLPVVFALAWYCSQHMIDVRNAAEKEERDATVEGIN